MGSSGNAEYMGVRYCLLISTFYSVLFSFIMVKLALVVLSIMVMQFSGVSAQCDCDMEIEDAASSTDNLLLDVQADLLDQMGELFDWISELKHTLHRHPPRPRPGYGYKKPVYGYKPAPYGFKKPAYSRW